ncbi:MAG: caspase family protein, partial [Bacteroidales bacterium]|nr:caspase family protein [Bacteroidales bacterium]
KSKNPQKQFDFLLTGNGNFTIDKYTSDFHDFVPFTESEKVNRYAANKLTVRKVDGKYYFFLNEQLVHSMPFENFYGNLMGIQVAENSTILVDYFKVTYLDEITEEQSRVLIMDYKLETKDEVAKRGLPITLTLNLKNVGEKDADDLEITYNVPENITVVDFKTIHSLNKGMEEWVEFQFYATKEYVADNIPVTFEIEGADLNNANDMEFAIQLDKALENKVDKAMAQTYAQFRGGNDPLKGLNVAQAMKSVSVGNYYAFVVGIDNYSGEWQSLQNAVNDAQGVEEMISEKYSFQHIKTLYNDEATRTNILKEFEWLMNNVTANDNVLIFYSGHGDYNDEMKKGFWVPVDATSKSMYSYISNEDIKSFLSGIKSKHTLLVTDACFSGDIFRGKTMTIPYDNTTKYYQKVYNMSSRKALTSGGIEPVMDAGKEGHSVFTYYFLRALNTNEEKFFDAGQLFNDLKIPVENNSYQTPAYSPVRNTGDEGGQFIFIKKE